jgi:hypothetical protein
VQTDRYNEHGDSRSLINISNDQQDYTASKSRRQPEGTGKMLLQNVGNDIPATQADIPEDNLKIVG